MAPRNATSSHNRAAGAGAGRVPQQQAGEPSAAEGEERSARYIVGIDLGTTNSAVAYVDMQGEPPRVETYAVPQLVAPGQVEGRETLPSFHYEPPPGELADGRLGLPFAPADRDWIVGHYAREQGEIVPGRLIASAKSWLCHAGVDRTAEVLPWHGVPEATRLSPVEASARYLLHIREAWNWQHPDAPLEQQDVVLTVPASFDEVARELTVKAAARAGLTRLVLLEEPQAAFYAWIDSQADAWSSQVRPGQTILVCDVGGGTTDFTLIRVRQGEQGRVHFHRVAVGEHLMLGGDNLDLALAHHVERRVAGEGRLSPRQWSVLVQACRRAKETLLAHTPPEHVVLHLPPAGSRLIGGSQMVELSRSEVEEILVEGFLPRVPLDARPETRRSGFAEFGLPYAPDPAITRYLAAFLITHRDAGREEPPPPGVNAARPDVVLFNGGFFASAVLRARLLEVLCGWFRTQSEPDWRPLVLHNERLDLAVARGAAYYGLVRRGRGVRISASLARTYYIGVDTPDAEAQALCLLPAATEPGDVVDLPERTFALRIREPVEFPLFVSSTRLTDRPGELVAADPKEIAALPPIRTVLTGGKKNQPAETVPVRLHARLTEIGTLDVWCSEPATNRSWKLVFDVRAATQTDRSGHRGEGERAGIVDEDVLRVCCELLQRTFASRPASRQAGSSYSGQGRKRTSPTEMRRTAGAIQSPPGTVSPERALPPEGIVKALERAIGAPRAQWPGSLLRRLWEELIELEEGRRRSPMHEARWLYLVGYALRPGLGMAVDDWRVAQTWRLLQERRLIHPGPTCRAEWQILWRRIAGGLTSGQQRALAEPLAAAVRATASSAARKGRAAELNPHEWSEVWRLLGALELLATPLRIELGALALKRLRREPSTAVREALAWSLARLGARVPLYGPLNVLVPLETAEDWLRQLHDLPEVTPVVLLAGMQLARRTGDRYRDVSESIRRETIAWLRAHSAPAHYLKLVEEGGELEEQERAQLFGESLPRGLRLAE